MLFFNSSSCIEDKLKFLKLILFLSKYLKNKYFFVTSEYFSSCILTGCVLSLIDLFEFENSASEEFDEEFCIFFGLLPRRFLLLTVWIWI